MVTEPEDMNEAELYRNVRKEMQSFCKLHCRPIESYGLYNRSLRNEGCNGQSRGESMMIGHSASFRNLDIRQPFLLNVIVSFIWLMLITPTTIIFLQVDVTIWDGTLHKNELQSKIKPKTCSPISWAWTILRKTSKRILSIFVFSFISCKRFLTDSFLYNITRICSVCSLLLFSLSWFEEMITLAVLVQYLSLPTYCTIKLCNCFSCSSRTHFSLLTSLRTTCLFSLLSLNNIYTWLFLATGTPGS